MSNKTGVSFASSTLPRHLLRGAIGFGALIGSVALDPVIGPVSFVLIPVGFLALRGCPTCWMMGLVATISAGRLKRSCVAGTCVLSATADASATRGEEASDPAVMDSRTGESLSYSRSVPA